MNNTTAATASPAATSSHPNNDGEIRVSFYWRGYNHSPKAKLSLDGIDLFFKDDKRGSIKIPQDRKSDRPAGLLIALDKIDPREWFAKGNNRRSLFLTAKQIQQFVFKAGIIRENQARTEVIVPCEIPQDFPPCEAYGVVFDVAEDLQIKAKMVLEAELDDTDTDGCDDHVFDDRLELDDRRLQMREQAAPYLDSIHELFEPKEITKALDHSAITEDGIVEAIKFAKGIPVSAIQCQAYNEIAVALALGGFYKEAQTLIEQIPEDIECFTEEELFNGKFELLVQKLKTNAWLRMADTMMHHGDVERAELIAGYISEPHIKTATLAIINEMATTFANFDQTMQPDQWTSMVEHAIQQVNILFSDNFRPWFEEIEQSILKCGRLAATVTYINSLSDPYQRSYALGIVKEMGI